MKIIYMGTPDFAVPALKALVESDKHTVSLVVTQPDRKKGRGDKVIMSDVKECALGFGIPVFQPEKVKTPEAVERLKKENADVIVVAAYGQILSQEILDLTPYGCINIHGSLLPAYRGAAPIQWAVINGEEKTGLTIMKMNAGLDTGDIMLQNEVEIDRKETAQSLYDKLSSLGGKLVLNALERMEHGTITYIKQDDGKSSYASMLKKEMGNIDFTRPAIELERLVRGLNSWPSAYTKLSGKTLKIWDADVSDDDTEGANPGTITYVDRDRFVVQTGSGSLIINEIQLEGKKRMSVHDFLLGTKVTVGEMLGQ